MRSICPPLFSEASLIVQLVKESACNAGHPGLIPGSGRSSGEVIQSSNFLRPLGLLPSRPRCPWDSPGKSTAVGCHFLLQESDTTYQRNHHHCCSKCIACVSDLLQNLSSFHRKAGGEPRRGMPCPRSYRWWAEGWETQPGDLRAEPPLATRVLSQRNKSGGFPGAVTWEAEGGTEHPWWFQEELC